MINQTFSVENRRRFLARVLKGAAGAALLYVSSPSYLFAHTTSSSIGSRLKSPKFKALMDELVSRHKFARKEIEGLFGKAVLHDKIPKLFAKPAEDLPYYKYRKILINSEVIAGGKRFLKKHRSIFEEVEKTYGVDQSVIAAILGIETKFGKRSSGGYRVFDALSTIFSEIPRRESFARRELIEFLLLCREEDLDPKTVEGSYAGAMGMPQFIPSSYRMYAVDFDGDGRRDLWESPKDIIGSVAHYLRRHGWNEGGPIVVRLEASPGHPAIKDDVKKRLKSKIPYADLLTAGVTPDVAGIKPGSGEKVSLLALEEEGKDRVAAVFSNFRTILKYNSAANYALAVSDLSGSLKG